MHTISHILHHLFGRCSSMNFSQFDVKHCVLNTSVQNLFTDLHVLLSVRIFDV